MQLFVGVSAFSFFTVNSRSIGSEAEAMTVLEVNVLEIGHSMFDWPLATQTSPPITLVSVIVFFPLTVSTLGWLLFTGFSRTIHLPSLAVVFAISLPNCTVIASPSSAQPQ